MALLGAITKIKVLTSISLVIFVIPLRVCCCSKTEIQGEIIIHLLVIVFCRQKV